MAARGSQLDGDGPADAARAPGDQRDTLLHESASCTAPDIRRRSCWPPDRLVRTATVLLTAVCQTCDARFNIENVGSYS